ncbi:MAG: DUF6502 family protein [Gammaproteobacteria bacterium]|nr:DUF6502 family protein [Gammaproteobacteria bacterium]
MKHSAEYLFEQKNEQKYRLLHQLIKALDPLIHILLRHKISFYQAMEIIRYLYVNIALRKEEFKPAGKREQSKSNVAIDTGLPRRAVTELSRVSSLQEILDASKPNFAERVLNGWVSDKRFLDAQGKPKPLPYKSSKETSFIDLVQIYSGDIPAAAMLTMLENGGAVKVTNRGIEFQSVTYVPQRGSTERLEIGLQSASCLLNTVKHNDTPDLQEKRLERKSYQRIPFDNASKAQRMLEEEAEKFIKHINEKLQDFCDPQENLDKNYVTIGCGAYFFRKHRI